MSPSRNERKSHGFTLIELLVVIAIIAILAAILFPVFAKAREKARQTTCLSNEKQLGLGFLQYNQDYDEYFPTGFHQPGNYIGSGWAAQIYPYIKSPAVYQCPDDTTAPTVVAGVTLYPMSYALSRYIGGIPINQFDAVANTFILDEVHGSPINMTDPLEKGSMYHSPMDFANASALTDQNGVSKCCANFAGGGFDFATGQVSNSGAPGAGHSGDARHSEGANWLMADGHAKWLRGTSVCNAFVGYNKQPPGSIDSPCIVWQFTK